MYRSQNATLVWLPRSGLPKSHKHPCKSVIKAARASAEKARKNREAMSKSREKERAETEERQRKIENEKREIERKRREIEDTRKKIENMNRIHSSSQTFISFGEMNFYMYFVDSC